MLTPSVSSEGRGIVGLDGSDEHYTREAPISELSETSEQSPEWCPICNAQVNKSGNHTPPKENHMQELYDSHKKLQKDLGFLWSVTT